MRAVKCVVNVVCPDSGIWPRYTVPTRLPRRSKTETVAVAPSFYSLWHSGTWTPSRPTARVGCHRPVEARACWSQRIT